MKSKWEWFRLLTPIILALCLFILTDVRANVIKFEDRLTELEKKVVRV